MEIASYKNQGNLMAHNHVIDAHEFLIKFLTKFDTAQRGGIHDFIELSLFNMINLAIKRIDEYLQSSQSSSVSGTEIMHIVVESYQIILDRMKRNLDEMKEVYFK